MAEAAIDMKGICKSYGEGDARVQVLSDVDFRVEKGEFVAVQGPSGSGKTTLMNLIGLIDTPDSGTYLLDGEDVLGKDDNECSDIRNRLLGFVFQKFNLIPKYTALYNVALPLILRGETKKDAVEKAQELLVKMGLEDRVDYIPTKLSGGQQQRVAIARALAGDAGLILADEPTGALDQATGLELLKLLQELNNSGTTIVLITHDPNIARQAGRVVHVRDGRVFSIEN